MAPDELAVPNPTISSFRELHALFSESVNYTISAAGFPEGIKHQRNCATDFFIRVQNNIVLVIITQTYWQRRFQLPLFCFVQFAALEAGADEVEFCLRHSPFQPQQKLIVEIGWVVTAILVDD